jgi:carbon-monoxide dehydrogenase medium subunit
MLLGAAPSEDVLAAAGNMAASEESPISDMRGSAGYRRYMTSVLVKRTMRAAIMQASA